MKTLFICVGLACVAIAQQVIMPWEIPCNEELLEVNLAMTTEHHLFGSLKDESGASFEATKVILRKRDRKGKFVELRSVVTNKEGQFDLGRIPPGNYRFLPAPHRGFKQPQKVSCEESSDCEVDLVLKINPTDQPFASCPIPVTKSFEGARLQALRTRHIMRRALAPEVHS